MPTVRFLASSESRSVSHRMVHSDNRTSSAVALGLFSTAIAICILLITAHDRPFIGQNGVQPTVLLQVQPDAAVENTAR